MNFSLKKLDGDMDTGMDYSAIILAAAGLNRMATQNEG